MSIASINFEQSKLNINVPGSINLSFKVMKSIKMSCRFELIDPSRTRAFCRLIIDDKIIIEIDREASEYGIVRTSCFSHQIETFIPCYKITFLVHVMLEFIGKRCGEVIEKKMDAITRHYEIVMV